MCNMCFNANKNFIIEVLHVMWLYLIAKLLTHLIIFGLVLDLTYILVSKIRIFLLKLI